MKEVIGTFTVTDGTLREQTVIISQETILDEKGIIIETRKYFTLNSIDGEEVRRCEAENTLSLADGTILRKISNTRFGDIEEAPRRRRTHQR